MKVTPVCSGASSTMATGSPARACDGNPTAAPIETIGIRLRAEWRISTALVGRRPEIELFISRQRAIGVGLLSAGSLLEHAVPHLPEEEADLDTGPRYLLDQGPDEGAVAGIAVESHLASLRRIGDENAAMRLDPAQASPDRPGG